MTTPFVHLRVHSEFSLVDGLVRIKPYIQRLTAHSNGRMQAPHASLAFSH